MKNQMTVLAQKRAAELFKNAKIPKNLAGSFEMDDFSLAVDCGYGLGVIEATECFDDKTQKVTNEGIQRLIDRADTYTEYVPRRSGIRIIGQVHPGHVTEIDCATDNPDVLLSVYRNCDRWVDISGIPIVDKPLRHICNLINEIEGDMGSYIYLDRH